jgi:hypothetical protein
VTINGATGINPAGIPYNIQSHYMPSNGSFYLSLTNGTTDISLTPDAVTISPSACSATLTIYSYVPAATTYTLYTVDLGSPIPYSTQATAGSCTASAPSGANPGTCTISDPAVYANTGLTLNASPTSASGGGASVAFSCAP